MLEQYVISFLLIDMNRRSRRFPLISTHSHLFNFEALKLYWRAPLKKWRCLFHFKSREIFPMKFQNFGIFLPNSNKSSCKSSCKPLWQTAATYYLSSIKCNAWKFLHHLPPGTLDFWNELNKWIEWIEWIVTLNSKKVIARNMKALF